MLRAVHPSTHSLFNDNRHTYLQSRSPTSTESTPVSPAKDPRPRTRSVCAKVADATRRFPNASRGFRVRKLSAISRMKTAKKKPGRTAKYETRYVIMRRRWKLFHCKKINTLTNTIDLIHERKVLLISIVDSKVKRPVESAFVNRN